MFSAINTRLSFVSEDDKKEYLRDFVEAVKHSSMVKTIVDENSKEKSYKIFTNMLAGVVSKPQ